MACGGARVGVSLWLAPAAGGKTAWVVQRAREAAVDLASTPRVVVPSHLQVRALRRRISEAGGALGVRILTFDGLYAECLNAAGEAYTELSEPVQYRLIRSLLEGLTYYAPLVGFPGFTATLQSLFDELKAALISPEDLTAAVAALGAEKRLAELAEIYSRYQRQLQSLGAADRTGLGWLAASVLTSATRQAASGGRPASPGSPTPQTPPSAGLALEVLRSSPTTLSAGWPLPAAVPAPGAGPFLRPSRFSGAGRFLRPSRLSGAGRS